MFKTLPAAAFTRHAAPPVVPLAEPPVALAAHDAPAEPIGMAAPVGAAVAVSLPAPDSDDLLPAGCGWFDSSLDLSRGLAVVEHAGFDAIGDATPLAWQLAAWL